MGAEHPRPDKHDHATLTTDSWAVHGGNRPDQTGPGTGWPYWDSRARAAGPTGSCR
jgi:hypothetical protein